MIDRLLWAALRWLPSVTAPWLSSLPAGDPAVGAGWPARWAASRGLRCDHTPGAGLVASLDALAGPTVDPASVHPDVRAVYEHTTAFAFDVAAEWAWWARPVGAVWAWVFGRRWGQLCLPLARTTQLSNDLFVVGDDRVWVRAFPDGRAMYVSWYDVVAVEGEPDPCIRVVFPVPGGAWVVLFRVRLDGDRLILTEDGGLPGGPGLYAVPTGEPARYVATLREQLTVWPVDGGAAAKHTFVAWGRLALTLRYEIPRR